MASSKQDSDSEDNKKHINTSQSEEYSKIVSTQFGDANAHDVVAGGFMNKVTTNVVSIRDSVLILDPTAGPSHQYQPDLNLNSEPRAGPSWKGQSGATEATDYTVFTDRIKEDYKDLLLPGIAWLTEGESSVEMNFVELTLNISGNPVEKEDIFNAINEKIPKRILIEGQPGIGKTSLASKLAFDWAVGKDYIAKHFKILLYLPLSELRPQQSFENAILEIGKMYGFEKKIEDIIKANEHNTLFVLDGLDEVSEMNRDTVLQLLYKKLYLYEHVCVLVTCRTGQFKLTETESKKLFRSVNRRTKFCDVQITVEGIKSVETKKTFLAKFIQNTNIREDEIISKLEKLSPNLDFFDSPLFLILMAFIVSNEENDSPIFTQKTELYKRLFNCIIKHSCKRNEILLSLHFDLFDVSSDTEDTAKKEIIGKFGWLSLQKIAAENTIFVANSFPTDIYDFGFLMKHKLISHYSEDINYEVFHFSILEFAAAYSVWIDFKLKNNLDEQTTTFIIKYFCVSEGTSLILPFLVGLLADDAANLFQLPIFQHNFEHDIDYISSMLKDCQTNDTVKRMLSYMENYLPDTVHLTKIMSFDSKTMDLCREIISFGAICGKIKTIEIDDTISSNLIEKCIFPNVKICKTFNENELQQGFDAVYANDLYTHKSLSQILSYFPLSNVTCQLTTFSIDLLNFDLCKVENNSVAITMSSTSLQSSFKTNRVLFSYLDFEIQTNLQKEYLVKILENNQVQYLNVKVFPAFKANMADIYRAVSQSEYLTSLKLRGATRIDLKDLTNNGSKDFALLDIDCRLICCHPLQRQIHCTSLSCFNISVSSLIEIEPINLTCTIETIDDVMKKCPSWTGFKSVNHLTVSINTNIQNLNSLLAYKNLQILCIIVNVSVDSEMVAQCIKYLALTELVIDYECLGVTICQSLFEIWEQNLKTDSNLQNITLKYFSIDVLLPIDQTQMNVCFKQVEEFISYFIHELRPPNSTLVLPFKEFQKIKAVGLAVTRGLHIEGIHRTSSLNDILIQMMKFVLSDEEYNDTIISNFMNDVYPPIIAESRALMKGLEKNYWQSVNLECVSEFQMNELELDMSKFNVVRSIVGSIYDNCVHKTNFDKHEILPIYNYSITRKLE